MTTVKGDAESALTVKKSRFLGFACRAETERQALDALETRRKRFFDASHHCYAYTLDNGVSRFSDDGEPSGTAGRPILEAITKSGLTDIIVVCTRYFGGTLLGAGGLARAYFQCAWDTLMAARKIELVPSLTYRLTLPYDLWARALNALKKAGCIIEDAVYSENITAKICVSEGSAENALRQLKEVTMGQAIPEFIGTKLAEISRDSEGH